MSTSTMSTGNTRRSASRRGLASSLGTSALVVKTRYRDPEGRAGKLVGES